jgi:hypothetical protein
VVRRRLEESRSNNTRGGRKYKPYHLTRREVANSWAYKTKAFN